MLTILLVDDEPGLLDLAVQYLGGTGPDTLITARSADEALAILAAGAVDAIVSDYEMPGKDGIAFLRELRVSGNTTPFILFTGKGREVVAMQALNSGADFYLRKGGDPVAVFGELRNMVVTAVERRRAVDEAKALADRVEHQAQILDEILSSIPDPVLILDPEGIITYANLAGAKVLGFSRMAILGMHIRNLGLSEDTKQPLRAAAESVFTSGQRFVTDIPWDNQGGVKRYRCSVSPLHTATGRINAVDIMFHDITDEARLERELDACKTRVGELLQRNALPRSD